ncbi:MAG: class I SAM-dependent methyltransferase [Deltaproteobacteria bacterium]|nr:class I SAM-dependent methyltransferase [Deltaproteobacteria bacterium]MCL5276643.1 class I SAM-dependent methyltransferase [Deltaproteobacteria bacterium]
MMSNVEKFFVNRPHRSRIAEKGAERMLGYINTGDVNPGLRYLEVGCGNGAAAVHIASRYSLNVTGIDVDPDQITQAQERGKGMGNVHFNVGDGAKLSFPDNTFDIVYTFYTTHHIADWLGTASEIERVLKPGGYFVYVDIVYPEWFAEAGKVLFKNHGFPTANALKEFLQKRGLSKVHFSKHSTYCEAVFRKANRAGGV